MRLFQKVLAGFLFAIGAPMLIGAICLLPNPNATKEDKEAGLGLLVLGVPPLVGAGLLVWNLRHTAGQAEESKEQKLEQSFLRVLQANGGVITPLRLAAETGMPISDAKTYLDEKAQELNATFDVSEEGGITYRFHF
ncbi:MULTISPECIES: hypothetical protein [unclassified Leptolyngbya]|uniref:hypothetical protein n=1 Tax=unclassified Leptolyngbya TaxID=2650499 RepID=UPI00168493BA|nr:MULTISPECIES: hypothetical protein [unclassified Leptolyngbya]MBD1910772.1 hypothetical protein [Leptolyngbya sp. FACHB-8]MBD2158848.1 hypothetical protein [Leptolyngbya sp. FACHB-16]